MEITTEMIILASLIILTALSLVVVVVMIMGMRREAKQRKRNPGISQQVDKKAIAALKDERHGVWLQVIFCFFPLTFSMIVGIFLLEDRIILQQASFFIFTASPGIGTYTLNILLLVVLIWGTVWVIRIDAVNMKYIGILSEAIRAGKRKDFAEFIKREAICEAYYEEYFTGKAVAPVPPPIIGKLSKKKK